MKLRLVAIAVLTLPSAIAQAQVSFPVVQTHPRLIEHTGHEKTLQGQRLAARREAQHRLKFFSPIPGNTKGDGDWAFNVGPNGPANGFPSVFTAGLTPSCSADYVAFTIHAQGTPTQANLVVLNNLYTNGNRTGLCSVGAPRVLAAYNVGTSAAGNFLGEPWPSADGTKIVVLEKGLTGTSTPARIHVITLGTGGGTVGAPITPPTETVLSYTAGGGSCGGNLSGASSLKDIDIWYQSGNLYAGDDGGRIYKITNAFTTPAVSYCASIGGGTSAITDIFADENVTGKPAGTNYVNVVLTGSVLRQYSDNTGATGFTFRWGHDVSATPGSITDFIFGDGDLNFIYLTTNHDASGLFAALEQWDYTGANVGEVTLGPASDQNLNSAMWDQSYQNNINATATFYYCAEPAGALGIPNLSDVQFDASWHMNSTPTMTGDTTINPGTGVVGSTCGPMAFYLTDNSTTPNPTLYLIIGVGSNTSMANRLSQFLLQTATTNLSPITSNLTTPTVSKTGGFAASPGGMSLIGHDWDSSVLGPETFNFYFGSLATQTTLRGGCPVGSYCFVKLQVPGLN
jgi:hypothetical protein